MRLDRRLRNLEASRSLDMGSGETNGRYRLLALLDAVGERTDAKDVRSAAWYERASPVEVATVALKQTETERQDGPLSDQLRTLAQGDGIPTKLFSAMATYLGTQATAENAGT